MYCFLWTSPKLSRKIPLTVESEPEKEPKALSKKQCCSQSPIQIQWFLSFSARTSRSKTRSVSERCLQKQWSLCFLLVCAAGRCRRLESVPCGFYFVCTAKLALETTSTTRISNRLLKSRFKFSLKNQESNKELILQ